MSDKSTWVTIEQLDTPLCDVFPGTKTDGTVRMWVLIAESFLGLKKADLESMEHAEMNKYIDSLDEELQRVL
ncbi:hypothetical protein ACFSTA_12430 [Ornithinibacillus salinisoli]|uniref:Uncharacterized protein n=1 Tax=Ornithinibacillus salinisoli TaxID=1848459 RepID=A0ABW4W5F6_9BACI